MILMPLNLKQGTELSGRNIFSPKKNNSSIVSILSDLQYTLPYFLPASLRKMSSSAEDWHKLLSPTPSPFHLKCKNAVTKSPPGGIIAPKRSIRFSLSLWTRVGAALGNRTPIFTHGGDAFQTCPFENNPHNFYRKCHLTNILNTLKIQLALLSVPGSRL